MMKWILCSNQKKKEVDFVQVKLYQFLVNGFFVLSEMV